jgi:TetR/AcrR family transcriptional repressor of nem operon
VAKVVGDQRAPTVERILDAAEHLVQTRGFNGFSYADLAAELQISKASLHYHFAGKADLGVALIERYTTRFFDALASIDAGDAGAPAKLEAYVDLYSGVLRDKRMCLCGMLAAEYQTLPPPMREAVVRFMRLNERWLKTVLEKGRAEGTLSLTGSPSEAARMILGTLEGAMLVSRPLGESAWFRAATRQMLASVISGDQPSTR